MTNTKRLLLLASLIILTVACREQEQQPVRKKGPSTQPPIRFARTIYQGLQKNNLGRFREGCVGLEDLLKLEGADPGNLESRLAMGKRLKEDFRPRWKDGFQRCVRALGGGHGLKLLGYDPDIIDVLEMPGGQFARMASLRLVLELGEMTCEAELRDLLFIDGRWKLRGGFLGTEPCRCGGDISKPQKPVK